MKKKNQIFLRKKLQKKIRKPNIGELMSNLQEVFKNHGSKRVVYNGPASKADAKTSPPTSKQKSTTKKTSWKKSVKPEINNKRTVENTPLDDKNILILDTASDSLNPRQANLFQVSMLTGKFNGGAWKDVAYRVNSVEMPAHYILSLEGEEDIFPYQRDKELQEVLEEVIDAMHKADVVIAYSASYHLQLLGCEATRVGFELPEIHVIDPFTIYSTVYKYSRGKKLTDALEKYGSSLDSFGSAASTNRTPLALKWLVGQMIQDESCAKFFDQDSLDDLTREQVISSAMNFIDLKEFFSKQSNGKAVTWRPWPISPNGTHAVPDGLSKVVEELAAEFDCEPEERPQINPVNFSYFNSNSLFQSLTVGLLSTDKTSETIKFGDCVLTSFMKDDNFRVVVMGQSADAMQSILSELNKFPITAIGVSEQIFEPESIKSEEDGTLVMNLILCQK